MIVEAKDNYTADGALVVDIVSITVMKLTERTVEELHATAKTTHSHRLDVFVFVAATKQRSIFNFVFCTSLRFQLLLL